MSLERVEDGDGTFESLWWSLPLHHRWICRYSQPDDFRRENPYRNVGSRGDGFGRSFYRDAYFGLVREDESWQRDDIDEQFKYMSNLKQKLMPSKVKSRASKTN